MENGPTKRPRCLLIHLLSLPSCICSVLYEILASVRYCMRFLHQETWSQILLNSYREFVAIRLSHTIVHSPSLGFLLLLLYFIVHSLRAFQANLQCMHEIEPKALKAPLAAAIRFMYDL